ncbi:MAG: type II/IV secretion system ATPase subunit [Candidatus Thermoplasmatota archaeon]|nr:type II/IV secretion system ATPase subunit [Candidatus Thermoplasmatota archaeon]
MGLLEIVQQKKIHSQENEQTIVKEPEKTQLIFDDPHGLLAKAKELRKNRNAHIIPTKPSEKNIEIIEEDSGLGWNKISGRRIVFDHDINECRYEIIEPELSPFELEKKKEIAHLFKMLADIDAFNMQMEEKEQFLQKTLDKIIEENNISFYPKKKVKNLFSKITKKKEEQTEEVEPEKEWTPEEIEESKKRVFYYLFRDFLGYGRIDVIMKDDGIEDISCDGHETPIFIYHRKYEAIETNVYFSGETELNSFIVRLCQLSGKQISIYSPIVDGKLPDGSRLQGTLARTVTRGSTFTIRKFKENPLTPLDLIEHKSLSREMTAYFWMAIENGASILFCGGTASGKTTALNALSLFIPASHKIISIEDTREVSLPHKNWIAGTTRTGFSSSEETKTGKDIDMFDLIRAALRQRPRVIIVGEVRGREAYSLFQAMATGHTSYATVHASTIHTLIQRLENPPISLPRALLTSLDIIVFQNAVDIGKKMVRRMTSVTEIIKLDSDTNQLIFMAPFQWVSKTDDRFDSSHTSKILNRIKQQNDWNDDQLDEEIQNRMLILQWMQEKDIRSYQEFGRVVAEYSKYPDQVINRAKKELNI